MTRLGGVAQTPPILGNVALVNLIAARSFPLTLPLPNPNTRILTHGGNNSLALISDRANSAPRQQAVVQVVNGTLVV